MLSFNCTVIGGAIAQLLRAPYLIRHVMFQEERPVVALQDIQSEEYSRELQAQQQATAAKQQAEEAAAAAEAKKALKKKQRQQQQAR